MSTTAPDKCTLVPMVIVHMIYSPFQFHRKKPKTKRNKGKGKKRISFDMVVTSDGKDTVFDCDGKNW